VKKYLLIVFAFSLVLIASHAQATILGNNDIAKGKTVVASSSYSIYIASIAVDGDTETYWNAGGWDPSWIKVDLGQIYSLSYVDLYAVSVDYSLSYSTDDIDWTTIASGALRNNGLASINFNGQTARYLKCDVTNDGYNWVALSEIAAYTGGASAVPEPATMLLLGFGLMGLMGVRRKFKK
jgi:hypothetical protein